MADEMSLSQLPLTLIVAATAKNGIGKSGGLPWPMLKKDMAYFARVTKRVPIPQNTGSVRSDALKESVLEGASRNVVIMGRKTWESIPPNRRPLPDRTNIVISSQDKSTLQSVPEDVVVASDISSGLQTLEGMVKQGKALPATRAFVIGGSSIYTAALELPQTKRILMTRISEEYDCDTFFPDVLDSFSSGWEKASHADLRSFVGEEVEEGPVAQAIDGEDVSMEFELYER
ncbi:Dihydrofolate reductase [Fulvia fulva]|uniref:Dihydrofolate reductase n=1 Tax=Passalora fulva TaxID=5499 RepID=A0A9Q8P928_PASFU|nr:Dihydrofolate reductase [Fulvia fulva]KAK4624062.1 Dihydrofolate reductase [Fulvia fulva]KAK4625264.1 Dihydrofolate reductase [Fulvia fulva]UJO17850.1 Dihydrofolate reductase [Fulvia fulva]WPV15661.1 Dihydrofolate reductase [Fulvia fulva]WPV30208.1 Dihydrofolate reductase [Fulvia fulva]